MDGSVIELDPLANADGAGADDEHFLVGYRRRFVLLLVRTVEIRRDGLELGGTGVDHLVYRPQVKPLAQIAHLLGQEVGQGADLVVGKAKALGFEKKVPTQRLGEQPPLHSDNVLEAIDEPGVYATAPGQVHGARTAPEGGHKGPKTFIGRVHRTRNRIFAPAR